MIIFLQSSDEYDKLIQYDLETNNFIVQSKSQNAEFQKQNINGLFSYFDNIMVLFYYFNNQLWLCIDKNIFKVTSDVYGKLIKNKLNREFILYNKDNQEICRARYILKEPEIDPSIDFTPFVSEEDFDFGLLLVNILKDQQRKQVLIENWALE